MVMGHHHQGGVVLAVETKQQFDHRLPGLAVEVAGGLVRQQQAGAGHEGTGNGDPLLLAAGEARRQVVQPLSQTDLGQQLPGTGLAVGLPPQLGRQHDVFQGAQGGQQQERLEHEPHLLGPQPGASLLVQPGEGVAEDLYLAAARQIETGQQTEQGGLAGTGRTDQRQRLAGIDLQIDPFKDGEAFLTEANGFTEPPDGDNGR